MLSVSRVLRKKWLPRDCHSHNLSLSVHTGIGVSSTWPKGQATPKPVVKVRNLDRLIKWERKDNVQQEQQDEFSSVFGTRHRDLKIHNSSKKPEGRGFSSSKDYRTTDYAKPDYSITEREIEIIRKKHNIPSRTGKKPDTESGWNRRAKYVSDFKSTIEAADPSFATSKKSIRGRLIKNTKEEHGNRFSYDSPKYKPGRGLIGKFDFKPVGNPYIIAQVVKDYLKNNKFDAAYDIASHAQVPVPVAWNYILKQLFSEERVAKAIQAFNEMRKKGSPPNEHTITIIFNGLAECSHKTPSACEKAYHIFAHLLERGDFPINTIHLNAALHVCAIANNVDMMYKILELTEYDIPMNAATYNTIISTIGLSPRDHLREPVGVEAKAVIRDAVKDCRAGKYTPDSQLVISAARLLLKSKDSDDWCIAMFILLRAFNLQNMFSKSSPPRILSVSEEIAQPYLFPFVTDILDSRIPSIVLKVCNALRLRSSFTNYMHYFRQRVPLGATNYLTFSEGMGSDGLPLQGSSREKFIWIREDERKKQEELLRIYRDIAAGVNYKWVGEELVKTQGDQKYKTTSGSAPNKSASGKGALSAMNKNRSHHETNQENNQFVNSLVSKNEERDDF
ncbi:uncharacterized protein V1516DRAFT_661766 [Lipomyces oligophaga]|uniref:uncharacterized protein n=1 Tax=Lipomyces oligophaga TaxID=45792 RepID=UPI0034CE7296